MRKFRIRLLIIAIVFILAGLSNAFAQNAITVSSNELQMDAAKKLVALNLLKGYDDGTLGLERPIRRVEFCAVVTRMQGYEGSTKFAGQIPFKDVQKDYWGYEYIATAYELKTLSGFPDGTFKPDNQITYGEAVSILVRAMGYAGDVKGEKWPDNYMEVGSSLGITKNLSIDFNRPVTRGEISILVSDSLEIELK
ncbi:MAG: S-layer homology domain-containing protein [Clostridia bacterium]